MSITILLAAAEVVKAGGLGNDISELPAAGSAPKWMSEKAISIGHYFVASGVYTVFGVTLPVSGAPVFQKYIFEEFEKLYGGMWDLEVDPIKHAHKMLGLEPAVANVSDKPFTPVAYSDDLKKDNANSKKGGDLNAEKRRNRPPGPGPENGTRPGKMQS